MGQNHASCRWHVHTGRMVLQAWLASVPGVVVAAFLGYLNQRRLQRMGRKWEKRAEHYMDVLDLLNNHNREMWQRLYGGVSPSESYPQVLPNEADVMRRTDVLASDTVRAALSYVCEAIVEWREADETRLDEEPKRFLGSNSLFGDMWHTPRDDFIVAGERADGYLDDLCELIRAELDPKVGVRWRMLTIFPISRFAK
jgi:hypothetical protein